MSNSSTGVARRAFPAVWIVATVACAVDLYLTWDTMTANGVAETAGDLGWSLVLAVFVFSGALIVSRQPSNMVGWLLLLPGLTSPISTLATSWLLGMSPPSDVDLLLGLALWFAAISWVLLIFPIFHLMLVFPTGKLQSPRWRWVMALELSMLIGFVTLVALSAELQADLNDETLWTVPNPVGFIQEAFWDSQFPPVWSILLLLLTVLCVAAMVQRYRKAGSVEKEQMKWLLLAVGFFGLVYAVLAVMNDKILPAWVDFLFVPAVISIPIAIAIAVLRYRLFDIDRLVSRTVSYALVVGVLAALFFGIVSLLTGLIPPNQNDLTIAASTLVVFALFNPLRQRIQGLVDRRFNRSRYNSQRVIDGFSETLRNQIDSDQVVEGWVGVVNQTMQPSAVGVWVR